MSDTRQNSGDDQHVPPELVSVDEFWRRCSPNVRAIFARMGHEFRERLGEEASSQTEPRQGTTRRREDSTESPRPRQVARTTSPNRAIPLDDTDRDNLMQRISILESQLNDTETENRHLLERAQALESENMALKEQVRRLERQRD